MLFHSGMRKMFPLVSEAIRTVLPVERLRYVGLSHFEADECGALNFFLAAAPQAEPVCGAVAATAAINDYADRAPRVLADGEESRWAVTRCAGTTPRTCRTPGNAG